MLKRTLDVEARYQNSYNRTMLDYQFIKENLEEVERNIQNRFMKADARLVVSLIEERSRLIQELEARRADRNQNAQKMKAKLEADERQRLIEEGKNLKDKIAELEDALANCESRLEAEARKIPNMAHPAAPIGKEEKDNLEIARYGEPTRFDFKPLDHVELGQRLDIIDFDAGTKVTGTKFYFLKNEGVLLEWALVRYALDKLLQEGFTLYQTPDLAREEILEGIGFNPRGDESNIYTVEGTGTCLIGTAEITLGGYHANEIIDLGSGAIRMGGVSHCFRREAGAAGQFSKGLYRVHQFTKVEMFVYCRPEQSEAEHERLRCIEEDIFKGLGVPFRVIETATGDLGAPAYRKWDLEAWMPGRSEEGDWGEVTSTSNTTDFQARRLGIRYKDESGKNRFVHMLNGTAIAVSRAIIAILENFQRADGTVVLPQVLVPYMGIDTLRPRR